ncbi:hypothetical protein FACS1894181_05180 [Bacteroidia bacterium]|nr:hypothetical protein FACS1894181_05180 [Bacteroidia bacterium]
MKMNTPNYFRYIIYVGSVLLLGLWACEERMDINTEASPPRLVIYGSITTDTTQHAIRITRSAGYFSTSKPEGISRASVSIRHEGGTFALEESPGEPGLYLTSPNVSGIEGETYTLHVALDFDGNGETEEFEATSGLPFASRLDSVAVQPFIAFDNFLQVVIWGHLPESGDGHNYFSFHLYRNNVLVNDSLRGFSTGNDDFIAGNEITAFPVFFLNQERDQYKLSPGDTVTIQVESITREYASFIENARSESFGSIPIFSGPPANVETNIRSQSPTSTVAISGFFTAYSKSRMAMIYRE